MKSIYRSIYPRSIIRPLSLRPYHGLLTRHSPWKGLSRTQQSRLTSTTNPAIQPDHHYLFSYTSGRWLWNEPQRLLERYTPFNVPELQAIAAASINAKHCTSITKIGEGSSHKAFRLVMDDGRAVVARIPMGVSGTRFYGTASEVATMEFVRVVLGIPVPRVYAWDACENPVGVEYVIMEEVRGRQLAIEWDGMKPDGKLSIMTQMVDVEAKLASLRFTHYGNIYFRDAVQDAVPAEIVGDVSDEIKKMVYERFSIGPVANREFWNKQRSTMDIDRGPWTNPLDYLLSIARKEIAWIKQYATPKQPDDPSIICPAQNDPSAHINLLEKYIQVAPSLLDVENKDLTRPTLWHPNAHSPNIFVEGDNITGLIDWQGAWVGPLFLEVRPWKVADHNGEVRFERPDDFDQLNEEKQAEIKTQIAKSTLCRLYLMTTQAKTPDLADAFVMDHGKTRRYPVLFAGDSWDGDILMFRESLIKIQRYWYELGVDGPCPIHFSEEEIENHLKEGDGFNEIQDLFQALEKVVQRDGWTFPDTYDTAVELFEEFKRFGYEEADKENDRDEFKRILRWIELGR
ncbi:hypothetical protein ASPWEDRAFT_158823 [Aspergillus wentii DTO 134E9]|uniref:Aminoglycoside phosphotransferase domain-containing protein n=1 Tax=Aspergillus wentii DTO 134E9 TaxID=1073089 RepID=A0A1L9RCV1_ASPWE|nr:uncharacterized protein ASPWEDRAFT_158823 [Aspergillus wentii DTO 134E9]OJJ32718.1 hypothetical protein ASPWEDRAFT_158823 [Aspergillus wentii DTO 134E9]